MLQAILQNEHEPDNIAMKVMYENIELKFIGVERENIAAFVRACMVCKRHQPLQRVFQITSMVSIHPLELFQKDCADMRNFSSENDGVNWI